MPTIKQLESYDHLEATLKAERIPTQLWDGIGEVWVKSPSRAYGLIARFKDTGATQIKLKQAPADEFDQLATQIAQAARARAMAPGGDKPQALGYLRNVLTQITGQRTNSAGGSLGDDEKARTTKAARPSFDDFLGAVSDQLVRKGGIQEL